MVGLVGFVVEVICIGAFVACTTHGVFWSIDMPIYGQLLQSLPTPPGLLPRSDRIDLTPYHQWAQRDYYVDMDHVEVVNFFKANLAQQGWTIRREANDRINGSAGPAGYLERAKLLFTFQQYWLYVQVLTWVDAEGRRIDNPLVTLAVSKDEEAMFRLSGFLR